MSVLLEIFESIELEKKALPKRLNYDIRKEMKNLAFFMEESRTWGCRELSRSLKTYNELHGFYKKHSLGIFLLRKDMTRIIFIPNEPIEMKDFLEQMKSFEKAI